MIPKIRIRRQKGITMIELMMTTLILSIIVLGVTAILVGGLKNWRFMYSRQHRANTTSASFDDAYEARLAFDRVARNASIAGAITDKDDKTIPTTGSPSLKIFYYSPALFTTFNRGPDCYAKFSYDSGANVQALTIECRKITGDTLISSQNFKNITGCVFKQSGTAFGTAIQMLLTMQYKNPDNNRTQTFDVVSSAYLNCN